MKRFRKKDKWIAPPREKDCLPRGEVLEPDLKRRAAREGCRGKDRAEAGTEPDTAGPFGDLKDRTGMAVWV